jgi:predicted nucleic acid-binding Zn ribbon protein
MEKRKTSRRTPARAKRSAGYADQEAWEELQSRQKYPRMPRPIASLVADALALRGYAQADAAQRRQQAWESSCGPMLAGMSRATEIRRGVMTVLVGSSMAMQEISLQKETLLQRIRQELPEQKIRDLRFRVGRLD